ncbi:sensor histidine kinase [Maribellus sediminis]|uniref:sensor histidine kinase n=1 Tax=Maribellus sediminis TaxID=2696285 RepID=UPI00142FAD66|nr:ATP-binding protein [Maribellus sediminis]
MPKFKFEYKITLAYLLIGSLWIIFSDKFLITIIDDIDFLTDVQTYKGWFYVLITALLFFLFLKRHLKDLRTTKQELENHKNNLQNLVLEKTKDLDAAFEQLEKKNKEINLKNQELERTLKDLKEAESHLLQAEKMASIGILTAGIAHEINNPLNYILGGLTGLQQYFEEEKIENEKVTLFTGSIETGIERVNAIVSGLNKLSRNKEAFDEACDVHDIIDNCLNIIGNRLKNGISVSRHFAKDLPVVKGNVGQLHQVFLNILVNASQAIPDKGKIEITTKNEKDAIFIEVKDNGCGIEQGDLKKVTDPFFTTKEPGEGTGLGLAITYNIIEEHKGRLEFESEVDKGTTVRIELPKS